MREVDVRVKFGLVFILSSLAVLYSGILPLTTLFLTSLVFMLIFNADLKKMLAIIKSLLKLGVVLVIIQSVFISSENPFLKIGSITLISKEGLIIAACFIIRMIIIVFSMLILSTSSDRELIEGLLNLKIPYELVFMASMAIKFLPILKENFKDTFLAVELRGVDIKSQKGYFRVKLLTYMLAPVVLNSINYAKHIAISVQMRGFRAYDTRTSYIELKFKTIDYYFIMAILILSAIFINYF